MSTCGRRSHIFFSPPSSLSLSRKNRTQACKYILETATPPTYRKPLRQKQSQSGEKEPHRSVLPRGAVCCESTGYAAQPGDEASFSSSSFAGCGWFLLPASNSVMPCAHEPSLPVHSIVYSFVPSIDPSTLTSSSASCIPSPLFTLPFSFSATPTNPLSN